MSGIKFSLGGKRPPHKGPALSDLFGAESDEDEDHGRKGKKAKAKAATSDSAAALPSDTAVREAADKLAAFVAANGRSFEDMTRERNPGESPFKFLHDKRCAMYAYYEAKIREAEAALHTGSASAPPAPHATAAVMQAPVNGLSAPATATAVGAIGVPSLPPPPLVHAAHDVSDASQDSRFWSNAPPVPPPAGNDNSSYMYPAPPAPHGAPYVQNAQFALPTPPGQQLHYGAQHAQYMQPSPPGHQHHLQHQQQLPATQQQLMYQQPQQQYPQPPQQQQHLYPPSQPLYSQPPQQHQQQQQQHQQQPVQHQFQQSHLQQGGPAASLPPWQQQQQQQQMAAPTLSHNTPVYGVPGPPQPPAVQGYQQQHPVYAQVPQQPPPQQPPPPQPTPQPTPAGDVGRRRSRFEPVSAPAASTVTAVGPYAGQQQQQQQLLQGQPPVPQQAHDWHAQHPAAQQQSSQVRTDHGRPSFEPAETPGGQYAAQYKQEWQQPGQQAHQNNPSELRPSYYPQQQQQAQQQQQQHQRPHEPALSEQQQHHQWSSHAQPVKQEHQSPPPTQPEPFVRRWGAQQEADFQSARKGLSGVTGGDAIAAADRFAALAASREAAKAADVEEEEEAERRARAPLAGRSAFERRKVVAVFKQDGTRGHHMQDFIPAEELAKFMAKSGDAAAAKAVAAAEDKHAIPADNIGHKLLSRMGWKAGEGVGANSSGITAPIKAAGVQQDGLGLGAQVHGEVSEADDPYEAYRKRMQLGYKHRPNPLGNPRKQYY